MATAVAFHNSLNYFRSLSIGGEINDSEMIFLLASPRRKLFKFYCSDRKYINPLLGTGKG